MIERNGSTPYKPSATTWPGMESGPPGWKTNTLADAAMGKGSVTGLREGSNEPAGSLKAISLSIPYHVKESSVSNFLVIKSEIDGYAEYERCNFPATCRHDYYRVLECEVEGRHNKSVFQIRPRSQQKLSLSGLHQVDTELGIAYQEIFKGADHASLLGLHCTKCSGLIRNILFQHFKSELQSDIDSGHFSLLIDESTDISVVKLLAVCIVYYSKQQHTIVSTFLGIVELEQGNADCIVSAIKSLLSDYGLDIKQMRGVGTDNASVMVGINNGVYQKLKQEVGNLVLIPCVCHSVQLAVSSAAEMLPRNVELLISETYSWFSKSSSRQITYRFLFQAINDGVDPLKILQQSNTRWLSIKVAVNRILNQWLELQTHFETSRLQNKCYTVELLFSMYCDVINKLYLVFLKPYLEESQKVNKSFQSSTADPSKLLKNLILLIVGITRRIVVAWL
ncbi:hypothetical protein ANN_11381 [Periplaneta americana]|uniref:DUF4371 domain-containing protein n=1 Tax=Periplaneta americana TaxID=6978 RepID=A0ABQ8T760_PERAM|nr:hypothetical protein ANN_11381 [Periplaneta americana]